MKSIERICIIGLIVILFFPFNVFAKDILAKELKIGPAKLKTSLSANVEYHSNINLKESDEKSSLIYRITPGLSLIAPLGFNTEKTYFGIEADMAYLNAEKGDATWTGHGRGLFRYNFSNLTSLGFSHDYYKGDLYGTSSGNSFDLHESQAMLKHEFSPRLSVGLGGNRQKYDTHLKGQSELFTDYAKNEGNAIINYELTPLTTLSFNGAYGKNDYNDGKEKDYDFVTGGLGISQKLTPRLTLGLNGGYTTRNYVGGDDPKEITWGSSLDAILSGFSTLRVTYNHGIQDTFVPKDSGVVENAFATDETLTNLLDESYRYVITDQIGVNMTYRFTDKDTMDLGGAYIKSRSGQDLASREPNLYSSSLQGVQLKERNYYYGVGVSHKFTSWCAFDLKGTYGERNSETRGKYDYYTATGGLSISF